MYDLFVIGGGSGGLRASRTAAILGAKVGLADFVTPSFKGNKWGLGGTCPNVGCIPKKLFHFAALCKEYLDDARGSGWNLEKNITHNWKMMRDIVINDIKETNGSIEKFITGSEVEYFNAFATIKDKNTIELKDKNGKITEIKAKYIIISVGGRPNYPDVKNIKELSITSDDLFFLEELPKNTLVIGAGYISIECGGFLTSLGSEVEILVRSKVLREFDQEMVDRLKLYMEKETKFRMKQIPLELNKKGDKIEVKIKNLETGEITNNLYDCVLCATGRTPDFKNLGLENIGNVKFEGKKIYRNKEFEINDEKNIFAIGDIAYDGLELTPVAIREGQYLSEKLFGIKKEVEKIDYSIVATTIYSPLEYSACGMTEEKAIEKYGKDNIIVFNSTFKPVEWLYNNRYPEKRICYCKIITLKSELDNEIEKQIEEKKINKKENNFVVLKLRHSKNKILGLHYLGPQAGEIMQGYAVAMNQGTTYGDFIKTVAIHPVISENFVNLKSIKL